MNDHLRIPWDRGSLRLFRIALTLAVLLSFAGVIQADGYLVVRGSTVEQGALNALDVLPDGSVLDNSSLLVVLANYQPTDTLILALGCGELVVAEQTALLDLDELLSAGIGSFTIDPTSSDPLFHQIPLDTDVNGLLDEVGAVLYQPDALDVGLCTVHGDETPFIGLFADGFESGDTSAWQ